MSNSVARKRFLYMILVSVLCLVLLPVVALATVHDSNGYDITNGYFDWKDTVVAVDDEGKFSSIKTNAWYNFDYPSTITGREYGFLLIDTEKDTLGGTSPWSNLKLSSEMVIALRENGIEKSLGTNNYTDHVWFSCEITKDMLENCSVEKDYRIYFYTIRYSPYYTITYESCVGTLTKVMIDRYVLNNCADSTYEKVASIATMGLIDVAMDPTGVKYKGLSYDEAKTGTLSAVSKGITYKVYYTPDHTMGYTASGNQLTAKCSWEECSRHEGVTITVSASDATYDGTPKAATLSGTTAWTHYGLATPDITYTLTSDATALSTAPSDVGEYTASISAGDVTASTNYQILKRPLTFDPKGDTIFSGEETPGFVESIADEQFGNFVEGESMSNLQGTFTAATAFEGTIVYSGVTPPMAYSPDVYFEAATMNDVDEYTITYTYTPGEGDNYTVPEETKRKLIVKPVIYEITEEKLKYVRTNKNGPTFTCEGPCDELISVTISGGSLTEPWVLADTDYTAESGSTILTLKGKSLTEHLKAGEYVLQLRYKHGFSEEEPLDVSNPPPLTSDSTSIFLLSALALCCGGMALVLLRKKKTQM